MIHLQQEASQQNHPKSALYMIATPIGNIADFTYRALVLLEIVDYVVCEDTRHSGLLLSKLGLKKKLISYHQHSEDGVINDIVGHLANQQRVAYISDAGTPAISDPGAKLVEAAQINGFQVVPIPGVSAVTTLLSVAGEGFSNYYFAGFLPAKTKAFEDALLACLKINQSQVALVLYESSHRIYDCLNMILKYFTQHKIVVGRELSKQFETLIIWQPNESFEEKKQRLHELVIKGEFCIAISKPILKTTNAAVKDLLDLKDLKPDQIDETTYYINCANDYPQIHQFFEMCLDQLGAKTATATILNYFAPELLTHPNTLKKLQKKDLYDWALFVKKRQKNNEIIK
jgi:16S rRNA (cytidine1402-2'-O)-methyltransferase